MCQGVFWVLILTSRTFIEEKHGRSDECPVICSYLDIVVFKGLCYNSFTVISAQANSFLDLYQKSCLCQVIQYFQVIKVKDQQSLLMESLPQNTSINSSKPFIMHQQPHLQGLPYRPSSLALADRTRSGHGTLRQPLYKLIDDRQAGLAPELCPVGVLVTILQLQKKLQTLSQNWFLYN